MRARILFLASLLAGSSAQSLPAQHTNDDGATLTYSRTLRALDLRGEPGRIFAVLASTRAVDIPLGNGVIVYVAPDVTLAIGRIGTLGHSYVPIDATSGPAGLVVYTQALIWGADADVSVLPTIGTEVAEIALTDHETTPPSDPPGETLTLVDHTSYATTTADLAVADGIPPMYLAVIDVEVPTGGHALRVEWVRHAGRFTRVHVLLERPGPDEIVSQGFERLQVIAELGVWIGHVEVVVDEAQRAATAGTR